MLPTTKKWDKFHLIYWMTPIYIYIYIYIYMYSLCNEVSITSSINSKSPKLVYQFIYLSINISSTENNVNMQIGKTWTATDKLLTIWIFDLSDEIKLEIFQVVAMSILLNGCTTWTLAKQPKKKLDRNNTRILHAVLYKSWKQHPARHPSHCWEK